MKKVGLAVAGGALAMGLFAAPVLANNGGGNGNGNGGGHTPVTICHKPGTPAEQTLVVDDDAVPGHLGHGDYLGACTTPTTPPTEEPTEEPTQEPTEEPT